jgi:hypothetical protein
MMLYNLVRRLLAFFLRKALPLQNWQIHNPEDCNMNHWMHFGVSQESLNALRSKSRIIQVSCFAVQFNWADYKYWRFKHERICWLNFCIICHICVLPSRLNSFLVSACMFVSKREFEVQKSVTWIWSLYANSDIMLEYGQAIQWVPMPIYIIHTFFYFLYHTG